MRRYALAGVLFIFLALDARAQVPAASTQSDGAATAASSAAPSTERNFTFVYSAEIATQPGAQKLEVWIPLPRNDAYQQVRDLKVDSEIPHTIVNQGRFANRVAHLSASAPLPPTIQV